MKQFFSRNIGATGRVLRAIWTVLLCVAAWFAYRISMVLTVALLLGAAFTLFEALRGWCVLRACGIKTKY
jgi:hypothetical protein